MDSVRFIGPIAPATNRGRERSRLHGAFHALPGDLRRRHIHLVHLICKPQIRLRDGRGGKRVRLDDVRARFQILVVNACDDVRVGQVKNVRVVLQINGMVGNRLPR